MRILYYSFNKKFFLFHSKLKIYGVKSDLKKITLTKASLQKLYSVFYFIFALCYSLKF